MTAAPKSRLRVLRSLLLIGTSAGAAMLAAGRADAQAFAATPTTAAGSVTYQRATPGVETIQIDSPTAIIVWQPLNTSEIPLIFLPAGHTATFENGANNLNGFTVLNRIASSVPARFDGTVIGRLRDGVGNITPGGTILFSSPGGIILGPTAVFDVGNLVLTSLNVVDDGNGNFLTAGGGFRFEPTPNFDPAAVVTMAGSTITATAENSYVAMVAPQVTHSGSVRVNGSAAYVGAETLEMRVNAGSFDIVVETGSDSPFPIIHDGITGGPASTGLADVHRIYMVAVPKNQAITAVLQGSVGFDPATDVTIENGAIILSAGFNVYADTVDRFNEFGGNVPVPDVEASFHITGGTFSSRVEGYAVTDFLASGASTGALTFQQDLSLFAGQRAHLFAGGGETVTAEGNVLVSAARTRSTDPNAQDFTGGEALIFAEAGGTLVIGGNAVVDASGVGRSTGLYGGSGTGGTAGVRANGGIVQIDGDLTVVADGKGGGDEGSPDVGGTGTGGSADLTADAGGTITIGGQTGISADGVGSRRNGLVAGDGAPGTGGSVTIAAAAGSSIAFGADVRASADGQGGGVENGAGNVGGVGQGGAVTIDVIGGDISFAGGATLSAGGRGGIGPNGGDGRGGGVAIEVNDGTVEFTGTAALAAVGTGGDAAFVRGGRGGDGTGGNVSLRARTGDSGSTIRGGALVANVSGIGGRGTSGDASSPAGAGGNGRGGNVTLLADAGLGSIEFTSAQLRADGFGGDGGFADDDRDGGDGGSGTGGTILAGTASGPAVTENDGILRLGGVDASATGVGGGGGSGGDIGAVAGGAGGTGQGGTITFTASGGVTELTGDTVLHADGIGGGGGGAGGAAGSAGTGGTGSGGTLQFAASGHSDTGAPGRLTAGNVTGTASGFGDEGAGNSPGQWLLTTLNGEMSFANLTLSALATGNPAVRPDSAIRPNGSTITVTGTAALTTLGGIEVEADGAGRIAGGRLVLHAGGDVTVSHTGRAAADHSIDVAEIEVRAENFTAVQGSSIRGAQSVDIAVQQVATVADRLVGREIRIASRDIDVTATGRIGDAATELVELDVVANGAQTVIGGTTEGPGYTLTDAEANRIRAATLRLNAPQNGADPQRAPDLLVRDLTLNGAGAASGIGALELNSTGVVRVEGAVLIGAATAATRLQIDAGERLEVLIPGGSLRVRDAGAAPAGTMTLTAPDIWVVGQGLYGQLRADPDFAGRDAALLAGDGTSDPRGFIEAGAVTANVGRSLFVQNSGGNPDFAGITVGGGALTIRTTGAQPASVYAFGRRLNPDGSFTTGFAFFAEGVYQVAQGSGGFTADSQLNTCIIPTQTCPSPPPPDADDPPRFPIGRDLVEGPSGGSGALPLPPEPGANDRFDFAIAASPLIEEPVTSGGDSTFWIGADEEEDEDE